MHATSHSTARAALAPRARRLQRALHDLGLTAAVGDGWVRIGDDGFEFATLSDARADRLVRALEELTERVSASPVAAAPPDPDARPDPRKVSAPARVPVDGASAHLELP